MAYNGWLIKIGDYTIPSNKFIRAESYSAYANMQVIDEYTDANGYLHYEGVELKAIKIEFETPAMLTNKEFSEFTSNIWKNITNRNERRCIITAYIPEYDEYMTQTGYWADFTPQMYITANGIIKYNPCRMAFIGGVYNGV